MAIKSKIAMAEGRFTPELIDEMKKKRGLKLRIDNVVFNEQATKDAIKRFVDGIGEPNPLWRDMEYAKKSRYGTIVAPPSWVFSALAGVQFGWSGLAGFHIATEMKFHIPVRLNDRLTFDATYLDFTGPKESHFAGKIVIDRFQEKYFNQRGDLIAVSIRKILRAERKKARMMALYGDIELPHPWTEGEIRAIEDEALSLKIRGSKIRYWEDVQTGEELPSLIKGPIGIMDMIAAMVAGLAPANIAAHEVALSEYRQKPAWAFRDPNTCALEPLLAVHYNEQAARAMGLPYPYDIGTQRQSWFIQHITNWAGDDGWLKSCYAEYRRFVFLSDVIRFSSKVADKYTDPDGETCVEIETHAYNQRGDDVMPGRSVIVLPSRERKTHPLDNRL